MTFIPVKDPERVRELLAAHRFKIVEGGDAYAVARKDVLQQVRRVSRRWFKLLRGVDYHNLFVFRFIDGGKMSLDLDVYGTRYEGILQIPTVMKFLLAAKSARWEFRDGYLYMYDKGKTDQCEISQDPVSGKVRVADAKDTLESA